MRTTSAKNYNCPIFYTLVPGSRSAYLNSTCEMFAIIYFSRMEFKSHENTFKTLTLLFIYFTERERAKALQEGQEDGAAEGTQGKHILPYLI